MPNSQDPGQGDCDACGFGPRRRPAASPTELVSRLCRDGASVDLVRDYHSSGLRPAVEALVGMPVPSDDGISSSQLVDLYLSLTRRKKVVSLAGAMLKTYTEARDSLNTSPGYATSLRMRGYDSIAGSLASSILHELEQAPANASAILPIRGRYRRPGFLTSSGLRRPTTCWAMPRSSKATAFVSISIRGLSTTMQTMANAISVGGGTPVSARTCPIGYGAR